MFCSKCGKEIIETDRYCSLCGQENTSKKEKSDRKNKSLSFNWKLILIGLFIFLFVKVLGSAFLSTIYPEIRISGWTEDEKSLYMNQCMETAVVDEKYNPPFHRHYATLYCICILEQTMILYPVKPPGDIRMGDFDKIKEVEDMGNCCLWKIGL